MKKGFFITVEGTDGSGKSTQIKKMADYLKGQGFEVLLTRDPGGNTISEKIRQVILDPQNTKMASETEFLLYSAARAQLAAEVIRPALDEGKIVICDRYIDSTYVYQGFGRGVSEEHIEQINKMILFNAFPNLTIFLDISPEIALKRRLQQTIGDRIENEKMDFHMKVYNGYKKIAGKYPDRIKVIDASGAVEKVFQEIKNLLSEI